jgi:hypothetical protein
MYSPAANADDADEIDDSFLNWSTFLHAVGGRTDVLLISTAAAAIFIYLGVLFFSSFFTYPEGVKAAFEAYALWTKTGSKDHTQNGMWAYFEWGFQSEAPIFVLSAIGTLLAFMKARHRFAMFAGLWAFGLLAAYTLIPYKTPWLALSFLRLRKMHRCALWRSSCSSVLRSGWHTKRTMQISSATTTKTCRTFTLTPKGSSSTL